jgi:hypothetical protein
VYSNINIQTICLLCNNGYIPRNLRFLARSMKTKGVVRRYPRKISLLKDLREGYPGTSLLHKSMKTEGEWRYPSKISLLKDLVGGILVGWQGFSWGETRLRGKFQIVKEPKNHAVIKQLMDLLLILSVWKCARQRKLWRRRVIWGLPERLYEAWRGSQVSKIARPGAPVSSLGWVQELPNPGQMVIVVFGDEVQMVDQAHGLFESRMRNGSGKQRSLKLSNSIYESHSLLSELGKNLLGATSVVARFVSFPIRQVSMSKFNGPGYVVVNSCQPQRLEVEQMSGMFLG